MDLSLHQGCPQACGQGGESIYSFLIFHIGIKRALVVTAVIGIVLVADVNFGTIIVLTVVVIIGHGIIAVNIACKMSRFTKSPIADVRFDLKLKLYL